VYAYHHPGIPAIEGPGHPDFARVAHVGLRFVSHPAGGCLATLRDWPMAGQHGSANPEDYGDPVPCAGVLAFLPPKGKPSPQAVWDYVFGDRAGADVRLACGIVVTVPVALVAFRQFKLTGPERIGAPVTEYGRLASELFDAAKANDGIPLEDPRLARLLALGFAQRYRVTEDLLDWSGALAADDIDALLSAIWTGDPFTLMRARAAAQQQSPS
jgi:hypothetical protein